MIKATGIVRKFKSGTGHITVLKGIDINVEDGEFVSIIGRSGAGKSTLIYQLGLLDTPTEGKIILNKKDVTGLNEREKTEFRLLNMGYIFQDYAILPELTAIENVALPTLMQGKDKKEASYNMSRELAKEKGVFPNYKKSIYAKKRTKMRNAARTTVAPTGSISMMLDSSSGVEPNFALSYIKQDKDGEQYVYLNRHFETALKERNFSKKKVNAIKDEVMKTGSVQHLEDLPQDLRDTFVVSMDISGEGHVKMQASFQKHVDNSISKTINFANSATKEDIKESYIQAWKLGCKSCTVYRDGSRTIQVLNIGEGDDIVSIVEDPNSKRKKKTVIKEKQLAVAEETSISVIAPRIRPDSLIGRTYKIKTGYGSLYITVNEDDDGIPFEVFATIGNSGGFFQEQSEAICRMVSLSLRFGIHVNDVIEQLKGIRGPMPVITEKGTVLSLPDAIGRILEEHAGAESQEIDVEEAVSIEEEIAVGATATLEKNDKDIANFGFMPGCPECGAQLVMEEGCVSCKGCGYSRCM